MLESRNWHFFMSWAYWVFEWKRQRVMVSSIQRSAAAITVTIGLDKLVLCSWVRICTNSRSALQSLVASTGEQSKKNSTGMLLLLWSVGWKG
ncbi:phosphofructokinase 1 [Actinidia rufa]|uniref:Phosphofructokinase 1 n=1 Tax=Actinidia rufa TaxID=165716 RepID=A0A7J0FZT5_9ERIC|nr:phosphofructokinase 1 [Actinidia rufa]